jgi:hypothetical protein
LSFAPLSVFKVANVMLGGARAGSAAPISEGKVDARMRLRKAKGVVNTFVQWIGLVASGVMMSVAERLQHAWPKPGL